MFQNVTEEDVQDDFEDVEFNNSSNKKSLKIKRLFSVQNVILYAVSFMASMVSFNGNFAPFGLAIFAAVCSNRIAARSCVHSMFSRHIHIIWTGQFFMVSAYHFGIYCHDTDF
ncbi:MAG: hypothetical protein FWC53_02220 [Firmicutes bacterium]|nr:hypothetical protein [Bacillota bacterium]